MKHLGDYDASTVIYGKFTTFRPSTGAPFTLAGSPALSVYKDNSLTQSTTGVTLTVDFDAVTGLHHYAIDTSLDGAFYSAGSFFDIVITTGTVDSVSMVGTVVASFTIRRNSCLKPATSGRTLVVDAAGLADANMVRMGPSGSGTAQTARDIGASVLISSGTGAGQLSVTSGVISANVTQFGGAAGTFSLGRPEVNATHWGGTAVGSATVRSDLINISGVAVSTSTAQLGVNVVNAGGTAWGSGAITAASLATGAITAAKFAAGAVDAAALATDAVAEIADGVWDEPISGHLTAGSTGAALNAAGSAGDPWSTLLPGAYGAGTAGKIIGDNINATISSRSTYAGGDTSGTTTLLSRLSAARAGYLDNINNAALATTAAQTGDAFARLGAPAGASVSADVAAVKSDTAAVKAKTDSLNFTVAGQVDANIQYVNDVQVTGTGAVGDEWGP